MAMIGVFLQFRHELLRQHVRDADFPALRLEFPSVSAKCEFLNTLRDEAHVQQSLEWKEGEEHVTIAGLSVTLAVKSCPTCRRTL